MNKELEALKHIISEISNYKLHGIGDKNWLGIQDVLKDVNILENALTPPTEQEVCKALSEWLKENKPELWVKKVQHDTGGFHYYNNEDYEVYLVEYDEVDKTMFFTQWLPPHLITMISRFYEGKARK